MEDRLPADGGRDSRRDAEFTEFVTARVAALRRVAYLLCQDWHHADDLVQGAITKLYVRWNRARAVEHVDAYARAVLVREFLSDRRSGWARRVMTGPVPDLAEPGTDHDAAVDLRDALAGLPARQRATVVLRFYCDLNIDQTAEVMGCSAGTVKSQTAKGLNALRRTLGPAAGPVGAAGQPDCPGESSVYGTEGVHG
ncbi:MAG TPA: SigE family RNA polymerase sigma factor [Streptosporangiaceae bacterium]|nr:SigE family RNA polymerase sigma factor [Streptosporangiaceae bacterium]